MYSTLPFSIDVVLIISNSEQKAPSYTNALKLSNNEATTDVVLHIAVLTTDMNLFLAPIFKFSWVWKNIVYQIPIRTAVGNQYEMLSQKTILILIIAAVRIHNRVGYISALDYTVEMACNRFNAHLNVNGVHKFI